MFAVVTTFSPTWNLQQFHVASRPRLHGYVESYLCDLNCVERDIDSCYAVPPFQGRVLVSRVPGILQKVTNAAGLAWNIARFNVRGFCMHVSSMDTNRRCKCSGVRAMALKYIQYLPAVQSPASHAQYYCQQPVHLLVAITHVNAISLHRHQI